MLRLSNIRHLTVHWHKQNKYEGAKLNTGACYYIYWNYQDFILTFILKHKGNTGLWPIYITKLFFGLKVFVNICQKKINLHKTLFPYLSLVLRYHEKHQPHDLFVKTSEKDCIGI